MKEIFLFRNEIIKWSIIFAAFAEGISLIIIGPNLLFLTGLVLGAAVAAAGFAILTVTGINLVNSKRKSPVYLGYLGRLIMYGAAFVLCMKLSLACAFGCGIGYITIPLGIMFLYGIYYRFINKKKNPLNGWTEEKTWNNLSEFDEDDDW